MIGSLVCAAGVRVPTRGPGPGGPAGIPKDLTWLVPRWDVALVASDMLGQPDLAFNVRAGLFAYTTSILKSHEHTGAGTLIGHFAQWGFVTCDMDC